MSTPTQVDELAVLRQTVSELTAKNAARKQRIAELEAELATSQSATQTAQASLHRIEVETPMQALVESISPLPELLAVEMSRLNYKVVKTDGKLLLTRDGKPVEGAEVTADGLRALLLTDDPAHKNFRHLITVTKASGGGAVGQSRSNGFQPVADLTDKPIAPKPRLGLGMRG